MKVGDLVRYKSKIQDLEGWIGIIVGWDGEFPVVLCPVGSWRGGPTPTDLIEVLNESR